MELCVFEQLSNKGILKRPRMDRRDVLHGKKRRWGARRWIQCLSLPAFLLAYGQSVEAAAVNCQADRPGAGSVLYLYFPTSSDSDFPDDVGGIGYTTSPLAAFDVSDLDSSIGTTGELRDAVVSRVKSDYCEFNVRIVSTTSSNGTTDPTPSDDRWQVVGIGSDFSDDFTGPAGVPDGSPDIFGVASDVDTGDSIAQDFSRIFAGSFAEIYGDAGEELNGTDSTLGRWANAIAGTTSHEAGHNYGAGHGASIPEDGEGPRTDHLMASGTAGGLNGEDRVQDRHFSNTSFELLAANIGLYQQTVSNWDFVNPNDTTADGFSITILVDSSAGTPSVTSVYTGSLSPWNDVSISADGSETFQGTNYNRFTLDFIDPKGWSNGDAGEVDAGDEFHVGVGLDTNYIVRETEFRDGATVLALRPRVVGYSVDASFDPETGDYHATLFNDDPSAPLTVSDIEVLQLPRTVAIDQMVTGGALLDDDGEEIEPWASWDPEAKTIVVADSADLSLGNLANPRAVDFEYDSDPECEPGIRFPPPIGDATGFGEIEYCPTGRALGLFPSARVFVIATVTDPEALHFDPDQGRFVVGPVSTRLFFQVTGKTPDLNDNGIDDAIDIDTGACEDADRNGVCDHTVSQRYKYAAKLVCGVQPKETDGRLVRGVYATTINVFNPLDEDTRLTKILSLSYPPEEQRPSEVLKIGRDRLGPNQALKTDCADIERRLFPGGFPNGYIEGFVTIESLGSLDVTAVYSSRDVVRAPRCHGQNSGTPGAGQCGCKKGDRCKSDCEDPHGGQMSCQPPDAISTTLDVEQIRERVLERKSPPEPRECPDLTLTGIGRPAVKCPNGSGTCRTTVDITIANIGNGASGPFQALTTLDPRQSVSVDTPVPSGLNPGQTTTLQVVTRPGGNCYDPDCTVTVEADSRKRIKECREDNNTLSETTPGKSAQPLIEDETETDKTADGEVIVGNTEPQIGKQPEKPTGPTMLPAKNIQPPKRPSAIEGGMVAVDVVKPAAHLTAPKPGQQPPSLSVASHGDEQLSDAAGPRGQHVVFTVDLDGAAMRVGEAVPVPGGVQKSRYLQGLIVWRSSIDGQTVEVGSLRDPREQHSLIPPEELDGEYVAPAPTERGSFQIPVSEKYLGHDDIARMQIEVFRISVSVPFNSELNPKTVDEIVSGAKSLGVISGNDLNKALYELDQRRNKEQDSGSKDIQ